MRRPHGGALCCHNNAPRTPPTSHHPSCDPKLGWDRRHDTLQPTTPAIPTTTTPFTLPENWEFREQATEEVFRSFVSLFIRFMEDAAGFAAMHLFLMCFVVTSSIFLK